MSSVDMMRPSSTTRSGWLDLTKVPLGALLMTLFVASTFAQFEILSAGGRSLNLYHILAVLLTAVIVSNWLMRDQLLLHRKLVPAVIFILLALFPAMISWRISLSSVLPVFAILYFIIGVYFGQNFTRQERLKIYSVALAIFLAATLVRNLVHIGDLPGIYSRSRANCGCFLHTGGRNAEATMLCIIALLYAGKRQFLVGFILTATVFLFQSRVGIIGAMMYWSRFVWDQKTTTKTVLMVLAINLSMLALFFIGPSILGRFSLENEIRLAQNGLGRLAIWTAAIDLFPDYPLGAGPSMAMPVINENGFAFWENNIHNVYLSFILELGWVHGSILGLFLAAQSLRRPSPERLAMQYVALMCLFQFTGYDSSIWLLVGTITGDLLIRDARSQKTI